MPNEASDQAISAIVADLQTFAARLVVHRLSAAETLGLSPTDLGCMCLLQLHGAVTPGWLADRIGLSTGAVTGMLDRLERAGYVTRAQDPVDRRRVIIQPDLGRFAREIQQHNPAPAPANLEFLDAYSSAQLSSVRRFVADLAEASTSD